MFAALVLSAIVAVVVAHSPNPDIGLNEAEKAKFLQIHNDARRRQGASNMYELEWDDHLAIIAWRWAHHCNFTHGQLNNDYGDQIGQNLYITEGDTNKYGAVATWLAEGGYYHYDTGYCEKQPCGHYTMGAWGTSYKLGCAHALCPSLWWPDKNKYLNNAHNIVCHYWPAGNLLGQKPFKKGPACSECANGKGFCKDGLCQAFCEEKGPGCECSNNLKCKNCGTTDPDTCGCKCQKGFQGTWCDDVCRNKDARCAQFKLGHCTNPKYGKSIRSLCPLACELCEYQEDKAWACQGKTWHDVFGIVDANPTRDERGCVYPFIYRGRYHDQCVQDPRRGFICSRTRNLDRYRGYANCTRTMTYQGEYCHFPFIHRGKKHYQCLPTPYSTFTWCGLDRNGGVYGRYGVCKPSNGTAT